MSIFRHTKRKIDPGELILSKNETWIPLQASISWPFSFTEADYIVPESLRQDASASIIDCWQRGLTDNTRTKLVGLGSAVVKPLGIAMAISEANSDLRNYFTVICLDIGEKALGPLYSLLFRQHRSSSFIAIDQIGFYETLIEWGFDQDVAYEKGDRAAEILTSEILMVLVGFVMSKQNLPWRSIYHIPFIAQRFQDPTSGYVTSHDSIIILSARMLELNYERYIGS